jgi:hypothetical protein
MTRQWVSTAGTIASCGLDVTLLQALPQLKGQRILVVSNLRDNELLLPHYMQQLVTAAALLPGEVFVSGLRRLGSLRRGAYTPAEGRIRCWRSATETMLPAGGSR